MSSNEKIQPAHLQRHAYVYVRQSTASQVQHNRESRERQYKLVDRAMNLGWRKAQIKVVDEDLGHSGSGIVERTGFTKMTAEVALGQVGMVLSIEVSRVARNSADWYRLLDLCSVTDTLIGDEEGIYHPGLFNDRLLLGLKGTMAEAELHVMRARLNGGIRNKAARGELRRGLPVGLVWGDRQGEVLLRPDQAITGAIRTVFEKFAELGSVRQVWLWFRSEGLLFPFQAKSRGEILWMPPTYTAIHQVLTNPVYAGAYTYGRTKEERYVDEDGRLRKRVRRLPRAEWSVLIRDHHEGFIDWDTYEMNQKRISRNARARPHQAGGAVREGAALLQGIATCGSCGRKLKVAYRGRYSSPSYYCAKGNIAKGTAARCVNVAGTAIDKAVSAAFLNAVAPAGMEAVLEAERLLETEREAALKQWRVEAERARYQAERAERQYRAVEPENRLVARTLEVEWEKQLEALRSAEAELARREQQRPRELDNEQRKAIRMLGGDLTRVWDAQTTTDRDRKELLRTLLEEVSIAVDAARTHAHLILRWRGGMFCELDIALPRGNHKVKRTDEDTAGLLRRLAAHYPDATIAGILNRQGRRTANGLPFTANRVGNLRRSRRIPRFRQPEDAAEGELLNVATAARKLGVATTTVHRWLNDGFIAGEQLTPGAPWQIRVTDDWKERFVEKPPSGYVTMQEATQRLGVTRQTVMQRVKRGDLDAVYVCQGKRKGLRIKVLDNQPSLFDSVSSVGV